MRLDAGATETVADGNTTILVLARSPWSVFVHPGAGATANVEISATPTAELASARWITLESNLATPTAMTHPGPVTAVRVTASGGDVVVDWIG